MTNHSGTIYPDTFADHEAKVLELVRKLQGVEAIRDTSEVYVCKLLAVFISDPRVTNEVNRILND